MRALTINEELIGSYPADFGGGKVEIYKNPKSVSRMGSWARALTNYNGDFYIASVNNETQDNIATTHTDMCNWLSGEGEDIRVRWKDGLGIYVNGIAWQRYKNTRKFYLSESYAANKTPAIEYATNFMNEKGLFNPMGAKFILELIDDAFSIERSKMSDIEQYHHDTKMDYF